MSEGVTFRAHLYCVEAVRQLGHARSDVVEGRKSGENGREGVCPALGGDNQDRSIGVSNGACRGRGCGPATRRGWLNHQLLSLPAGTPGSLSELTK